ncbi:MAG: DUF4091 domain-containing protein [Nitrospiraceae bacterium]|nr:DUF4091 domain-containing protein [Nitrospiraceae bacterium]
MKGSTSKIMIFLMGILTGVMGLVVFAIVMIATPNFRDHVKNFVKSARSHLPALHVKAIALKAKTLLNPQDVPPRRFMTFPFPGSRAERSQGILSWIAPLSMRVQPQDAPPDTLIGKSGSSMPISLVGLKGETLSFQVVLRGLRSSRKVRVHLLPAASDSDFGSCIRSRRFLEFYEHFKASAIKYGPVNTLDVPDPLIPFHDPYQPGRVIVDGVDLSKDKNTPVWIDVRLSQHCLPKTYDATLVVQTANQVIRKTPVKIEVLNVTLPERVGLDRWMELYVSRFWKGGMISSQEEFRQMYLKTVLLGHQYGFATNDAGDILPGIQWDWKTGTPLSVDWSYYDNLFGPILSGQLTGKSPNVWCLPIQTYSLGVGMWGGFTILGSKQSPISSWKGVPDVATQNLAKLIVAHWKEKGWPIDRGFAYIFDEPMHKLYYYADTYKLIAKEADSLHKGSKDLRVMITDTPYVWYRKQAGHDKKIMTGKIDLWAAAAETYIPERMQERQKKGERVWFYQGGGPPFIGQSDLYSFGPGFRMWFWTAWKYRSNGVFYWADTFWHGNQKGWNPYLTPGIGDGMVFYPGKQLHYIGFPDIDGPIPSIRMAQWRRGYQDYKYLYLLKMKDKGKEADSQVNELVRKALNDGGYLPYWNDPLWQKPGNWSHDPQAWHKARVRMALKIAHYYNEKQ